MIWQNYEIQDFIVLPDHKNPSHWSSILAVSINFQIMKYLLLARTYESHELSEVRISVDPLSELIVWSPNVNCQNSMDTSRILET